MKDVGVDGTLDEEDNEAVMQRKIQSLNEITKISRKSRHINRWGGLSASSDAVRVQSTRIWD